MPFPWSDDASPLRCDEFMDAALHDPEQGYYARRIRSVGHRGDFSTAATLSPTLGTAIAAWAAKALRETKCRDLIELGPGTGELAETVLKNLPRLRRWGTRLHLVESSAPLAEQQRARLGRAIHHHDRLESALEACRGHACIYSNEFVDAFPARVFRRNAEDWSELFVSPGSTIWQTANDLPESSVLRQSWPEGQVVEVHESYHEWMKRNLLHWRRGRMLTIDYGSEVHQLYHRQPRGSLRSYFHHQRIAGDECFERPGHQDLTADVNFTDLSEWSTAWAQTIRQECLADFLKPHLTKHRADAFLTNAAGSGNAFICLEQEAR